ncbi:unnamed protein product [Clonostachys rosea]|uniref:Uncharacterized protein n=1 Tax=Bionectria ochroleuca TaxID=29856 RepID=A0ABY6TWZ9_BIOOC|nr:unnamed protein product [Clonostachys rosea]
MDIRSGVVCWHDACPGGLMKKLQSQSRRDVRKIKSLDTCYQKNDSSGSGSACAGDLGIVHRFIRTIDALEALSIRTMEEDVSQLWPVIFRQADSLMSLTFRPYRGYDFIAVAPPMVREIASRLHHLTHLGVDVSLKEAEAVLKESKSRVPVPRQPHQEEFSIDELVKIDGLKEVELFIKLQTGPSSFCARNEHSASGTTSDPPIKPRVSLQLAQCIFNKFLAHDAQSPLERVSIHFLRNCYADRGHYDVRQSSAWVIKTETGFEKEVDRNWQWDREETSRELWEEIRKAHSEFGGRA